MKMGKMDVLVVMLVVASVVVVKRWLVSLHIR